MKKHHTIYINYGPVDKHMNIEYGCLFHFIFFLGSCYSYITPTVNHYNTGFVKHIFSVTVTL